MMVPRHKTGPEVTEEIWTSSQRIHKMRDPAFYT